MVLFPCAIGLSPCSTCISTDGWLSLAVVWHLAKAGVRLQARGEGGPLAHHQALFTRFVLQVEARYLEHWPVARYAAQLGVSIPRLNRLIRVESGNSALALIHERLTQKSRSHYGLCARPMITVAACNPRESYTVSMRVQAHDAREVAPPKCRGGVGKGLIFITALVNRLESRANA